LEEAKSEEIQVRLSEAQRNSSLCALPETCTVIADSDPIDGGFAIC
jgi:hypothetical protein